MSDKSERSDQTHLRIGKELLKRQIASFTPALEEDDLREVLNICCTFDGFFSESSPSPTCLTPSRQIVGLPEELQLLIDGRESRFTHWNPSRPYANASLQNRVSNHYLSWVREISSHFSIDQELLSMLRAEAWRGDLPQTALRDIIIAKNESPALAYQPLIGLPVPRIMQRVDEDLAALTSNMTLSRYKAIEISRQLRKLSNETTDKVIVPLGIAVGRTRTIALISGILRILLRFSWIAQLAGILPVLTQRIRFLLLKFLRRGA